MGRYDHITHAGNAGDVWKHLLLLEAADCLLDDKAELVYAESHVGRPCYLLEGPGEWVGGIGKLWPLIPSLCAFPYFRVLSDLNRSTGSRTLVYPGSARLVHELAFLRGADLRAEVWDDDPAVAASWDGFLKSDAGRLAALSAKFSFHQADGFSGIFSLLRRSSDISPGLLFIDPPYVDPNDLCLVEKLLEKARDANWTVLWWHMRDVKTAPEALKSFDMNFSEVGLDGGRWRGAGVAATGKDGEQLSRLLDLLKTRADEFIRILKSDRI
jgi:23S rRNA (adenine2030-N6)-methyltransferase